jgi:type IV pilus assembly protein PilB
VNLVLAQRLARRICSDCKQEIKVPTTRCCARSASRRRRSRRPTAGSGRASRLPTCNGTGYKGRVALYEVMPMWDELKELVLQGASAAELKTQAIRCGHAHPAHERHHQVPGGVTTTEEIIRVTLSDMNKSGAT